MGDEEVEQLNADERGGNPTKSIDQQIATQQR